MRSTPGVVVNDRTLLRPVRNALEQLIAPRASETSSESIDVAEATRLLADAQPPSETSRREPDPTLIAACQEHALAHTARVYGLGFEHLAVLLVALAPELDPRLGRVLSFVNDRPNEPCATIGFAENVLRLWGFEDRTALRALASGPLVDWQLVSVEDAQPGPWRRITVAPDVVQRVNGVEPLLERIAAPDRDALAALTLPVDVRAAADRAVALLANGEGADVRVLGPAGRGRRTIARAILSAAGWPSLVATEHDNIGALLRAAAWNGAAMVVERSRGLEDLIARCPSPTCAVLETASDSASLRSTRRRIEVEVSELGPNERRRLWERRLPVKHRAAIDLDEIARRFRFDARQIVRAAELALARCADEALAPGDLYGACRDVSVADFGERAQVLPHVFDADDLVVTPATRRELDLAVEWATHRDTLSIAHPRGRLLPRGLACLFHGQPGTGKTLAAQVLAGKLGLRLVRIDLAQVVNKYIGETEKNLSRLFDAARADNAILFFDEADALFGRRTDVDHANDRYANLETGFLLQRIEDHPGIAILATNLLANIDPAFMRRLQVVAEFAMPGVEERARIWERHLPPEHDADVDRSLLAQRFALSGGDIRNVCFAAQIMAAAAKRPLAMNHVIAALCRELVKLGRLVEIKEFGPWAATATAWLKRPV